jgi:hypothetical protein
MKSLLILVVAFAASAFAAEKYNKHFENPVVDPRIEFTSCAVSGALFGIAEGKPGDVLCVGSLKGDKSKKPRTFYVYKAEKRKTLSYFEEVAEEIVSQVGDDEGGEIVWKASLQELNDDLTVPVRPHVSTLKIDRTWEFSEGSVIYKGKLPGGRERFEFCVTSLSSMG